VHSDLETVQANTSQALAETKILNDRLSQVEVKHAGESGRITELAAKFDALKQQFDSGSLGGFKRDKFDPAFIRVRFTGFANSVSDDAKLQAIEQFMKNHFADIRVVHSDHFNKKASFIQLATPRIAKIVLDRVKEQKLKLGGFTDVKISQALPVVDVSRNWSLYKAEELVKADPSTSGKSVEVKTGNDRGVYVAGTAAFLQAARHDPRGNFVGDYVHLKLP